MLGYQKWSTSPLENAFVIAECRKRHVYPKQKRICPVLFAASLRCVYTSISTSMYLSQYFHWYNGLTLCFQYRRVRLFFLQQRALQSKHFKKNARMYFHRTRSSHLPWKYFTSFMSFTYTNATPRRDVCQFVKCRLQSIQKSTILFVLCL